MPDPTAATWTAMGQHMFGSPTEDDMSDDRRPTNCRFRLRDEGKPYPKSSCLGCGRGITTGLGNTCSKTAMSDAARIAELEAERDRWKSACDVAEADAERAKCAREDHAGRRVEVESKWYDDVLLRDAWQSRAEAAEAALAARDAEVAALREALGRTAEQAMRDEIPERSRGSFDPDEFNRGYDAAIRVARAALNLGGTDDQ